MNKEDFGFVNEFLIRWKFNFLVVKWLKVAWLVGLSDMGYDKGFEMGKLEFCLILLDLMDWREG